MSLCVRFVGLNDLVLWEVFLQFKWVHDTAEKGLASLISKSLKQFGVENIFFENDGAAAMTGIYNGL